MIFFCRILENDDFDYLAYKIKQEFPNECRQTYYVPPISRKVSKSGKSLMAKRQLIDKYKNKRTFIRNTTFSKVIDQTLEDSVNQR